MLIQASNLPQGATLTLSGTNPATAVFEWTPAFDQADFYSFEFFAVDQIGGVSNPTHVNVAVKGKRRGEGKGIGGGRGLIWNRCILLRMGRLTFWYF